MSTQKSNVIDFFSRIPKTYTTLYCMFCGSQHSAVIPKTTKLIYHGDCPGCDEEACVPFDRIVIRSDL